LGAGNYVIQVHLGARGRSITVLAGIAISREDIGAAEADMLSRYPIELAKNDDSRHSNLSPQRADSVDVRRDSAHHPVVEIEGLVLFVDRLGTTLIDQGEGSTHRRDVNRKI
jgi:hypothetical protein